jgi:hypothetical protein
MTEAIIIRNYSSKDFAFIINSWLKSYQASSSFAEDILQSVFFKFHKVIAENILNRPTTTVLLAVDKEDQDIIYGYAIFENINNLEIFHYIYVKRGFNHFGIAKKLIESAPFLIKKGVFCSHLTRKGRKLLKKIEMVYNPYLI